MLKTRSVGAEMEAWLMKAANFENAGSEETGNDQPDEASKNDAPFDDAIDDLLGITKCKSVQVDDLTQALSRLPRSSLLNACESE